MGKKQRKHAQSVSDETNNFSLSIRRTAVSLAVAAALPSAMMAPQTALAQDDDDDVMEEIVSYGTYTQSLASSMDAKRNNSSIVEAISAEDIGKLPDISIAESLARLPGLTVQRLNGRGQVVNVRGMSPDFSTGIMNGREQVSVGDNRGVEFDQYPSELLQQVIVYKTPDAALIGQGLSGTVDLRTARPLDYGERAINLNARYDQAEYDLVSTRDDTGMRFSATYIDQFADDTVGIMVGYAHTKTPNFGRNNNAWGYYVGDGNGNVAVGGGRVWARASELERDAFAAALDYKPTDRVTLSVDAFLTSFKEDQIKHGMVMNLDNGALTATRTENGVVVEGFYTGNTRIGLENNVFLRDADMQSFGANLDIDLNNGWVTNFDVSHSSIDRSDTAEFESNAAVGGANGTPNAVTDRVDFITGSTGTRFGVGRDYSNIDYSGTPADAVYATSPYGWGDPNALAPYVPAGQFGYNKVFDVEDDINAFRAELERDLDWGPVSGVEFGYNLTKREKSRVANEGVITSGVDVNGTLLTETEIPASIAGTADLSWGMLGSNRSMVSYDPYALLAAGQIQQGAYLYDDIFAKSWVVEEDVHTAYVKFEVSSQIGDMPLTGNFGLQWQNWDQSSVGQNASGSGANVVFESFGDSDSGDEVLPSLNLSLDLADNQILRFAAARTLARPRMDEMKAAGFYGYNVANIDYTQADVDALIATGVSEIAAYQQLSPWSRTGGNTRLKPWVADAFDLSYEYYFEESASYIAAAIFYKDLKSYIFDQTLLFDFTGLPPQGPAPQLFIGPTTSPQNGQGGWIKGYELAATIQADLFSEALAGLGVTATYSHNDSNIEANGPGSASKLPGLSDEVWNLTLFYEREGFSARIAQRYRSGYIGEVAGFGGARTGTDLDEETVVDAQVSYQFQAGMLEGVTVMLQGYNLTDERFQRIDPGTGLPTEYQTFGAMYQLGVSWSY